MKVLPIKNPMTPETSTAKLHCALALINYHRCPTVILFKAYKCAQTRFIVCYIEFAHWHLAPHTDTHGPLVYVQMRVKV